MSFKIIMPVYNGESFISRSIESVLGQSYRDWKLIIVNDGSTDKTFSIVEKYLKADPRISLIDCSASSGRPAVARNLGLRQADGEYIAFLDSDDIYYPEKLLEVIRIFERDPTIGLVCHGEKYIEGGHVQKVNYYGPYKRYEDLLFRGNSLSTSAVVFRRVCLNIGYFSEKPEFRGVEDYDFWMRLAKYHKISYLRKVLGEYHIRRGSVSSDVPGHCANTLSLLEDHFSRWPKKNVYYKRLMKGRKAACIRSAAKTLISQGDFKAAGQLMRAVVKIDPFSVKNALLSGFCLIKTKFNFR